MLPEDVGIFLQFAQDRDPVIVTLKSSNSPGIRTIANPLPETQVMTLWNQAILGSLSRKHIVYPGRAYYVIDISLPTLEFSPSRGFKWNDRDALLPGRIYGFFDTVFPGYEKWYKALARWIRKNFVKNPLPLIGYVGPAAYDWYKKGGLLLPSMLPPPITTVWLSWVEAQDQHRAIFSK